MTETNNSTEEQKKIASARFRRFNRYLQMAIKLKGYNHISEFAKDVGFDRSYISGIIHGHQKPTLDHASKIAVKLNVSLWDIFFPEDIRDLKKLKIPEKKE